jgi:hypothetical protein
VMRIKMVAKALVFHRPEVIATPDQRRIPLCTPLLYEEIVPRHVWHEAQPRLEPEFHSVSELFIISFDPPFEADWVKVTNGCISTTICAADDFRASTITCVQPPDWPRSSVSAHCLTVQA